MFDRAAAAMRKARAALAGQSSLPMSPRRDHAREGRQPLGRDVERRRHLCSTMTSYRAGSRSRSGWRALSPDPTGFRQSLIRTINAYANENKLLKEARSGLSGEDLHEELPRSSRSRSAIPSTPTRPRTSWCRRRSRFLVVPAAAVAFRRQPLRVLDAGAPAFSLSRVERAGRGRRRHGGRRGTARR